MPIYEFQCNEGHTKEIFLHSCHDLGCETLFCESCGDTMGPVISQSNRMLWYEQGKPRTIWNLGPEPITVRSHKEHREAMKKAGVVEAGNRIGEKGSWV
jgi:hypothetical protein